MRDREHPKEALGRKSLGGKAEGQGFAVELRSSETFRE
jgi:hypothetical protein